MRPIDADEYFEVLRDDLEIKAEYFRLAVDHLHNMKTLDAVEVVRCKDCIHWKPGDSKGGNNIEDLQVIGGCKRAAFCRREMDFCSFGEMKYNAV